jgi:SAM-dependent methyltransferase
MKNFDQFNIEVLKKNDDIDKIGDVDKINKEFYSKFSYPWKPILFQSFPGVGFSNILNNDIGYYKKPRVPQNAKIWVAGCGTNQAIFTALRYPESQIIATDVSTGSLRICQETSSNLNLKNLTLLEKSINESDFENEFDYVICTGVVHHNADPNFTLSKLSKALKNEGVLEFMVYNYYHRIFHTAIQKAIGYLDGSSKDISLKFEIAKKLIEKYPYKNIVFGFLQSFKGVSDAQLSDALFQPVEYNYTVESLNVLLNNCNLEYLLPCNNQFDCVKNVNWNINFNDGYLNEYYNALPDIERWQVINLLTANESPLLWFYLQRKDSIYKRRSEREVCEDFLNTRFEKFITSTNNFLLNTRTSKYELKSDSVSFPSINNLTDQLSKTVYLAIDPLVPMKVILERLKIKPDFDNVNRIRTNLTSVASPYINSVV